jgi:hypothetical protein
MLAANSKSARAARPFHAVFNDAKTGSEAARRLGVPLPAQHPQTGNPGGEAALLFAPIRLNRNKITYSLQLRPNGYDLAFAGPGDRHYDPLSLWVLIIGAD